jgi:hypothetical protein
MRYNECNGVTAFITRNWIDILQSFGIIAGLLTSAYTIHKGAQAQRVQNLFTLTSNHREIWREVVKKPELARVLETSPDLDRKPITAAERLFVLFLILHLASSFEARKHGLGLAEEGLRADIQQFFAHPIAREVWTETKSFQAGDFVAFVDSQIQRKGKYSGPRETL